MYAFSYPGIDEEYPDYHSNALTNGRYYLDTLDKNEIVGVSFA